MKQRPHKYGARKVQVDGHTFDSTWEARRYQELRLLERAGGITGLEVHPDKLCFEMDGRALKVRSQGYPNGRRVTYQPDFSYHEDGHLVLEDAKGMDTEPSRLRRALVELFHGVQVRVTRRAAR